MDRRWPHCGCYTLVNNSPKYLPLVHLDARVSILSSTSRTTLTQTFINPQAHEALKEARYVFPLYDGVSIVGFTCTIGSRVIKGVVKERQEAKRAFDQAVSLGQMAGLLEQSEEASDVFTTALGNIPAGEQAKVEITYLGELNHDAEFDGLRFTIPTSIAPRYGASSLSPIGISNASKPGAGISVTVDADMSEGSSIQKIQSPSHPISVNIGATTSSTAAGIPLSLQRASATLSLTSAELDKDFILQLAATGLGDPAAILETHPSIPNQRALMATLVPRFNLDAQRPEVVFLCDRSGSMASGQKMPNLISALHLFLKSLPVGAKFNICSFGSKYSFLWSKSRAYDQESLDRAISHVKGFAADYGGTQMYEPMKETFNRRYKRMNLEVLLLTDGEIWSQEQLFQLIREETRRSKGAIRVFTLGIGQDVSHALIEGAARAGNGFSQTVAENEKMDKKIVRMLKGALTPHVHDYTLEIKYEKKSEGHGDDDGDGDDDFELVEKVMDALTIDLEGVEQKEKEVEKKTISLFDKNVQDKDLEMSDTTAMPELKLPAIAVPRYLQTPLEVPALFPFNRTTVYILLSDYTPKQQPKSVVLRGTCDQGPLGLEIPIAVLAEAGTTTHQMAAKKAIGELEEGSGWIYHAKDGQGNLLKEEFESDFSDMVKREAVRLGEQYQIAGKWTSFVAVQDADKNAEDAEDLGQFQIGPVLRDEQISHEALYSVMGGEFGARSLNVRTSMAEMESAAAPPPALFRTAAPNARISAGSMLKGLKMKMKQTARRSGGGAARGNASTSGDSHDVEEETHPVSILASLQTFSGSWTWSTKLETLLGVTKEQASSVDLRAAAQYRDSEQHYDEEGGEEVLATLCVVVYLKNMCAKEKETWELLVDKAEGWLAVRMGVSSAVLEKIVQEHLKGLNLTGEIDDDL